MIADSQPGALYDAHLKRVQEDWTLALSRTSYDAAVVFSGQPPARFLDDQHYPFHANPHFSAWLPVTDNPGAVLIFAPGEPLRLCLHQPADYWHAAPAAPATWWAKHFQISVTTEPEQWRQYLPAGRTAMIGEARYVRATEHLNPVDLITQLHLTRTRKSAYEVACIDAAQHRAARGHRAAAAAFDAGFSEFAIHQAYNEASGQLEAELPYPSIIALNEHGAVLHYQFRERELPEKRRSFLIDAGARCYGYCSDITRTYTTGEDFGELIAGLDELQQSLCRAVRPGVAFGELHHLAHVGIAELLHEAGIISQTAATAVDSGLSRVFFPHGLGHFLGIQVHDVAGHLNDDGSEQPPPPRYPHLRLTRHLQVGNVLTIEPGIYFIDSLLREAAGDFCNDINWALVDALRPYGGIRIEDNVVVTDEGSRNLTREAIA
ncbi:MAG: Xaa-Pro dipeptidase [Pseudomonadota bacterium]